jgi:hypothetical protein
MRAPVWVLPLFSDVTVAPEAAAVPDFWVDFFAAAIHVVKHEFQKEVYTLPQNISLNFPA